MSRYDQGASKAACQSSHSPAHGFFPDMMLAFGESQKYDFMEMFKQLKLGSVIEKKLNPHHSKVNYHFRVEL